MVVIKTIRGSVWRSGYCEFPEQNSFSDCGLL